MNALGCNRPMIIHNYRIFFMIHSSIYIPEPYRCYRAGSHCFLPHWSGSYCFLLHSIQIRSLLTHFIQPKQDPNPQMNRGACHQMMQSNARRVASKLMAAVRVIRAMRRCISSTAAGHRLWVFALTHSMRGCSRTAEKAWMRRQ